MGLTRQKPLRKTFDAHSKAHLNQMSLEERYQTIYGKSEACRSKRDVMFASQPRCGAANTSPPGFVQNGFYATTRGRDRRDDDFAFIFDDAEKDPKCASDAIKDVEGSRPVLPAFAGSTKKLGGFSPLLKKVNEAIEPERDVWRKKPAFGVKEPSGDFPVQLGRQPSDLRKLPAVRESPPFDVPNPWASASKGGKNVPENPFEREDVASWFPERQPPKRANPINFNNFPLSNGTLTMLADLPLDPIKLKFENFAQKVFEKRARAPHCNPQKSKARAYVEGSPFAINPSAKAISGLSSHAPLERADHFNKVPLHRNSRTIDKHRSLGYFSAALKRPTSPVRRPKPAVLSVPQEQNLSTSFSSVSGLKRFRYGSGLAVRKRLRILREFRKAKAIISRQQAYIKELQKLNPPPAEGVGLDQIRLAFQKLIETPRHNKVLFQSRVNIMTNLLNTMALAPAPQPQPTFGQESQLLDLKTKYKDLCQLSKSKDEYIVELESHNQALVREVTTMRSDQKCFKSTASTLKELEVSLDIFIEEHGIPPILILDSFLQGPGCWPAPPKPPSPLADSEDLALGIKDRIMRIVRHPFRAQAGVGATQLNGASYPPPPAPAGIANRSPLSPLAKLMRRACLD
ncbi:hypothetical protein L0F63_003293 [Massospora cicadina]|nr:hypothetical protein L0F63_003293 [Massospora cicadina]